MCGHTQPLCWLNHLNTVLEHTYESPMFIRGPPSTTQTSTEWAHTTTVWVNSPQNFSGTHLSGPHVSQRFFRNNTNNNCYTTPIPTQCYIPMRSKVLPCLVRCPSLPYNRGRALRGLRIFHIPKIAMKLLFIKQ